MNAQLHRHVLLMLHRRAVMIVYAQQVLNLMKKVIVSILMSAYPHHVVKWKCAKTLLADSSANVNKEPHLTTTQSVLILTSVRKPPVPQMEFVLILSSAVVTAVHVQEDTSGTAIR